MASQDKGHPLPKFGEWDVNNPASADGFTVIFNKARDEKKTTATAGNIVSPQRDDNHVYKQNESYHQQHPPKKGGFVVAVDSSVRVKIALNGGWQVWEVSCAGANGFIK